MLIQEDSQYFKVSLQVILAKIIIFITYLFAKEYFQILSVQNKREKCKISWCQEGARNNIL